MGFDADIIEKVWQKGHAVPGVDSAVWRKDDCTAWIKRNLHGSRKSDYGWEIDHVKPVSEGGSDDLGNLRPLQWENNAAKQGGRLVCVVKANGNKNARS